MMTDPIADMLSRIRNAIMAQHERVEIPLSKLKMRIAEILKDEGYISDFSVIDEHPSRISVVLKYGREKSSAILGMQRTSRPGKRVYVGHKELPKVLNGMGIAIVSTSRGVLTSAEARKRGVGGEVLCEVW
jgi:small subunit ribosomal protein S8